MTVIPIVSGDIDEQTVVAVFSTIEQAQAAVDALHRAAEQFKSGSDEGLGAGVASYPRLLMESVAVKDPIPFNPTFEDLLDSFRTPVSPVLPEPKKCRRQGCPNTVGPSDPGHGPGWAEDYCSAACWFQDR